MLTITTCQTYPQPPEYYLNVQAALHKRGIPTQFVEWQNQPYSDYILPWCAWDYAQAIQQFDAWLQDAQNKGCQLANSVALMHWNSRKTYLLDLANAGFCIAPTQRVTANAQAIQQAMQQQHWAQAVIKPIIGQSGLHVQKITASSPIVLPNHHDEWLLQAYLPEVAEQGELCLIYLAGQFSHAVRRIPAAGEWRANSAYGAQVQAASAPEIAQQTATQLLHWLPEMPRYARIDGVIRENQFYINELELIEPALYCHLHPNSMTRLVDMIENWVRAT